MLNKILIFGGKLVSHQYAMFFFKFFSKAGRKALKVQVKIGLPLTRNSKNLWLI